MLHLTWQGPEDMQAGQLQSEQRQILILVYKHTVLWGGDIAMRGEPGSKQVQTMMAMPPSKCKKELQSFLVNAVNYLSKFSLMTADVCKPLQKLTSVKTEWAWNSKYQELCDKTKSIIKKDTCMKFYDASKPLYLETHACGISIGACLLQITDVMNCRQEKVLNNTVLHPLHLWARVYAV